MPITTQYLENDHIICYCLSDPFTVQEILPLLVEENRYRDEKPYKIHILVDLSGLRTIPDGYLALRNSPCMTHPNGGYIAFVGAARLVRAICEIICNLAHYKRIRFFKNEADARLFLYELIKDEELETRAQLHRA
jgi:hypothetical protein